MRNWMHLVNRQWTVLCGRWPFGRRCNADNGLDGPRATRQRASCSLQASMLGGKINGALPNTYRAIHSMRTEIECAAPVVPTSVTRIVKDGRHLVEATG